MPGKAKKAQSVSQVQKPRLATAIKKNQTTNLLKQCQPVKERKSVRLISAKIKLIYG
jgi:hypothetical protein